MALFCFGAKGHAKKEKENQHASPFDDAAMAAIRQSQFQHAIFQGNPVPAYITLWVPFNVGKDNGIPIVGTSSKKGVSAPMVLNSVVPEFPEQARQDKVDGGIVVIRVLVTEEGNPADAAILVPAGHGFDENALKAVAKYRFRPATLHGVPVTMGILVEVRFRL